MTIINTPTPPSKTGLDALIQLDALKRFVSLLDAESIDYALVGGVALMVAADESRPTDDLDFIVAPGQLEKLEQVSLVSSDANFGRYRWQNITIDALYTDNKIFSYALKNYRCTYDFGEFYISSLSAEGLFLLKLYALPSLYLQIQFARAAIYEADLIRLLLRNPSIDENKLLGFLQNHLEASQIKELREIVKECRQKLQHRRFS